MNWSSKPDHISRYYKLYNKTLKLDVLQIKIIQNMVFWVASQPSRPVRWNHAIAGVTVSRPGQGLRRTLEGTSSK